VSVLRRGMEDQGNPTSCETSDLLSSPFWNLCEREMGIAEIMVVNVRIVTQDRGNVCILFDDQGAFKFAVRPSVWARLRFQSGYSLSESSIALCIRTLAQRF
jgi:hypothetical protein